MNDIIEWVRNFFVKLSGFQFFAFSKIEGRSNQVSADTLLKVIFRDILLCNFWHAFQKDFKELSGIAIKKQFPFPSTSVGEQVCSVLTSTI